MISLVKTACKWLILLAFLAFLGATTWWWMEARRISPSVLATARAFEAEGLRVADLPAGWKAILLAVEDPAFYDHHGLDLRTPGAGLTTITQGLVKTHYFERFRPGPVAKLQQSVYALELDRAMAKDLQLTLLLNTASLGPGPEGWVRGFPDAAEAYFGKSVAELDRRQFVTLVAMLIGPGTFHPSRGADKLNHRIGRIEALLAGRCRPMDWRDVYYRDCG